LTIVSVNSMNYANVNFQTLRGRATVLGIFAFSWFMQAGRGVLEHEPLASAFARSLGFSIALLPLMALAAWPLWRVLFKAEKGLFVFSLAIVTAAFSAYLLAAGR